MRRGAIWHDPGQPLSSENLLLPRGNSGGRALSRTLLDERAVGVDVVVVSAVAALIRVAICVRSIAIATIGLIDSLALHGQRHTQASRKRVSRGIPGR